MSSTLSHSYFSVKALWRTSTIELKSIPQHQPDDTPAEIKRKSVVDVFRKLLHEIPNYAPRRPKKQAVPSPMEKTVPRNPLTTLLGCPGEIRNQIYRYLFQNDPIEERLKALHDRAHISINRNTHVLLVCRQIYEEARNLARPNVSLTPKHLDLNVKCVAGLTLPINNLHTARILQGATPPELIKTLILRDDLHDLNLYWEPPTGIPSMAMNLRAETLLIQLCICNSFMWTAGPLEGVTKFGLALVQFLESIPSVQRVIVYFCSRGGGWTAEPARSQFPKAVAEVVHARGPWRVKQWKHSHSEAMTASGCDYEAALIPTIPKHQSVTLEFYNSYFTSARYCVFK